MPSRCASSAFQLSAVNKNSLALRGPSSQGCTNHSTPQTPMVTTGSQNSASSLATIKSQAQASISPPAMHFPCTFGDGRFGQIAPAPGDLQVDLLLAGESAMGIGLGKTAPISDRRKIHARGVLGPGA